MTCEATVLKNPKRENPPVHLFIGLFLVMVCINIVLSKITVISFEIAPGVSAFYIVVAFMVVFTLWFGMWGAVAAYAGCFIGAGLLSGIPPEVSLYWSLADFWQVLIPLLAFRYFHADPSLRNMRDMGILLVFGVFLNNLTGALWGSVSLAAGSEIPWSEITTVMYAWWIGNCIVCLLLAPLILYIFTPYIRNHALFVREYWQ
jgi:integral membrane sensor domain MASE1